MANSGTLVWNNTSGLGVRSANAITGPGALTIKAGIMTVIYSEGGSVSSGTITVDGTGSGNSSSFMLWAPDAFPTTLNNNFVLSSMGPGPTRGAINQDGGGGLVTLNGSITLAGDSRISVGGGSWNDMLINGPITGPGRLYVQERNDGGLNRTLIITNGANDYAGGTTIEGGILLLTSSGKLGPGSVTVNSGGSLEFWTYPDLTGAGNDPITLNNNVTVNGFGTGDLYRAAINQDGGGGLVTLAGTVTLATDSRIGVGGGSYNDMLISGQVTGPGRLYVQERSGNTQHRVLDLSNNTNDYAGGTTVEGGVLRINAPQALGTGAVTLYRDDAAREYERHRAQQPRPLRHRSVHPRRNARDLSRGGRRDADGLVHLRRRRRTTHAFRARRQRHQQPHLQRLHDGAGCQIAQRHRHRGGQRE